MNSLISQFMAVWLHPWDAMSRVKEDGEEAGIAPSILFVIVMGLVSGLITSILGSLIPSAAVPGASKATIWLAVLVMPVASLLGSFIGTAIVWSFLLYGLLRGSWSQFKVVYRLMALLSAFSPVSSLLSPIPKVGTYLAIALTIWMTIVMIKGIIIVCDTAPVRTWVTCIVFFGLLLLLGFVARMAAQRELAANGPGGFNDYGTTDFGGATDDLGATSDNLEKDLQGLAEKAKEDQKAGDKTPEQPKK